MFRELNHIDIFIVSEKNQFTICIENKIDANESDDQLDNYRNHVISNYPGYQNLFIFLNPYRTAPSKKEWGSITYNEVVDILKTISHKYDIDSKVQLLINDYCNMLKGDILVDEKLLKICQRIYVEYQEALDLIYEAKPDSTSILRTFIVDALSELSKEQKLIFNENESERRLIRFQLKELNLISPDFPNGIVSGWNSQKSYYVEIQISEKSAFIQVSFNSGDSDEVREKVNNKLSKIYEKEAGKKRANWSWWVVARRRIPLFSEKYINSLVITVYDDEREAAVALIKESIEREIFRIKDKFDPLFED